MHTTAAEPVVLIDLMSGHDRYARLRLIEWWDQRVLAAATVIVVGAGALGNEVIKNLALLGVGRIIVIDRDRIETSNLTRAVLFRQADVGQLKAEVAAAAAMDINPDVHVVSLCGDVGTDLGLGVVRRADLIFSCTDNRRARLDATKVAWKCGVPLIDGGIDRLSGAARIFLPGDGPCWECTLSSRDLELLDAEYSCLGTRRVVPHQHIPTTPTITSVIAGLQAQIGLKLLHGSDVAATVTGGRSIRYLGQADAFGDARYQRRRTCTTHEFGRLPDAAVEAMPAWTARGTTIGEVVEAAHSRLGPAALVDLAELDDRLREPVVALICTACDRVDELRPPRLKAQLRDEELACQTCGVDRRPRAVWQFGTASPYAGLTVAQLGIPPLHLIPARTAQGEQVVYFELTGDAAAAFGGCLADRPGWVKGPAANPRLQQQNSPV